MISNDKLLESIQCCSHKLNLVVNKAISACPYVKFMNKTLGKHVTSVRQSKHAELHSEMQCTLVRAFHVRWDSMFEMFLSFWTSYKRRVFSATYACAYSCREIEKYLQILAPLFILSKNFQRPDSSICTVVPSLLMAMHSSLLRMVLPDANQNRFRLALVKYLQVKFEPELTSSIYLSAALLNVGHLKFWWHR